MKLGLPMRRLVAGALLVLGAAAILASQLLGDDGSPRLDGGDRPVNVGAGSLGDISAHNSPTLVRNPRNARNLVVTSRIDSPDFSCAVHVSMDDGRRWTRTRVPVPRGGRVCYAPDAAFSADGTLHVSYVTLQGVGNRPNVVWHASSKDGGRTLGRPNRVTGPLAFQVRIAADPSDDRRLYMTWVQAREVGQLKFIAPGNPVLVSRSDDGGATWGRPRRVTAPARGRVLGPSAAVGSRGEIYVLFFDAGEDRLDYEGGHRAEGGPPYAGRFSLVVARSEDRGATWQESVVDDGVVPTRRFIAFLPPFPSLALDRARGRLYVAFEDARLGDPDVYVWSLAPGSARWSQPTRVNDTPRRDRTWQYLPKVAVAPGGRVDVVYFDRRASGGNNLRNEVSLQSSENGGATFGPHVTLTSESSDARIGPRAEVGLPELGSRLALVSDNDGASAVWTDTRAGTEASAKQDLRGARVEVAGAGGGGDLRTIGLVAGVVMLLAGGAMLVLESRSATSKESAH
jgi:hypothetical protein